MPLKTAGRRRSSRRVVAGELGKLRARLAEMEETLRAITRGEVDAVVVAGPGGDRVFTLEGAEHAYRMLIESMDEGALTLTVDKVILYANRSFARMVKQPLERVTGGSFREFLSARDRAALRPLFHGGGNGGGKVQVRLAAGDGSSIPVQISICRLPRYGASRAVIGLVVTDMTAARKAEEMLRALTHRVMDGQEAERSRAAVDLHDNITQLLCAILFRSQALAARLPATEAPLKEEAKQIRDMLGQTAGEVDRITLQLRSSVLEQLGLAAALRSMTAEFTERTGVPVKLACAESAARLPADTQLALYRILQETLKNVERHARALGVSVCLKRQGGRVRLTIKDDGIGFDPDFTSDGRKEGQRLGLLGMREHAASVSGSLDIQSAPHFGTQVDVRVPLN